MPASVTSATETASHPRRQHVAARLWRRYRADDASRWATVISWNALVAFIPIVLLLVTVIALLLHGAGFARAVEARIVALGGSGSDRTAIRTALDDFRDRSALLLTISLITLAWTGSGLFSCMDDALSAVYGVRPRSFLRKRVMAMRMMAIFAVLLIPLLVSSTLLGVGHRLSLLPDGFPDALAVLLQVLIGALDATLIFLAVYHGVPNRRMRLRDIARGAVVAGVLLEAFTMLFPLYFQVTNGFATYGQVIALLLILIGYFFFLGQIVMIGALVNAEHAARREADVEASRTSR
jgi:membrane protein